MNTNKFSHGGEIYNKKILYDFSTNLNPLGIDERVLRATTDGIKDISKYPDWEMKELINLISEKIRLPKDKVVLGAGAEELIFTVVGGISGIKSDQEDCNDDRSGDRKCRMLLVSPIFSEYERAALGYNCLVDYFFLKEENDFVLTTGEARELCSKIKEYDAVVICNPGNPTGRLTDVHSLHKILCECEKTGVYLVVDESFIELAENDTEVAPVNNIPGDGEQNFDRLILIRSLTKTYCIPGLRLGYGVIMDENLLKMVRGRLPRWNISSMAYKAGVAIFNLDGYLEKSKKILKEEKEFLFSELCKPKLKQVIKHIFPTDTCYFLVKSDLDLYELLLEKKILIRDCREFDGLKKGYFRIAIKDREANKALIEALIELAN